jgi:hypothetical protein
LRSTLFRSSNRSHMVSIRHAVQWILKSAPAECAFNRKSLRPTFAQHPKSRITSTSSCNSVLAVSQFFYLRMPLVMRLVFIRFIIEIHFQIGKNAIRPVLTLSRDTLLQFVWPLSFLLFSISSFFRFDNLSFTYFFAYAIHSRTRHIYSG